MHLKISTCQHRWGYLKRSSVPLSAHPLLHAKSFLLVLHNHKLLILYTSVRTHSQLQPHCGAYSAGVRGKQITAIHTLYGLHVISCVLHVVAAFALYAVLFAIYVAAWLKQSSMLLTSLTCALDPPPLLQQAQRDAMMGRKLGVVRLSGLLHLEERPAYQEIARQLCRWDWMQGARER